MIKKCTGCGITLQTEDINKEGYTENIDNELCLRCFKLKNYGEYKAVTLNNKDYTDILNSIPKDALVVYLTSLLNINLEYINKFNNVILVLTKKDLLPKSVQDYKLINYVSNITNNYLDIEIISSIKNYNLDSLLNKIKKYNKSNKEIYFVGMTNSGKSTLINKLIKNTQIIQVVFILFYPHLFSQEICFQIIDPFFLKIMNVVMRPLYRLKSCFIQSCYIFDIRCK